MSTFVDPDTFGMGNGGMGSAREWSWVGQRVKPQTEALRPYAMAPHGMVGPHMPSCAQKTRMNPTNTLFPAQAVAIACNRGMQSTACRTSPAVTQGPVTGAKPIAVSHSSAAALPKKPASTAPSEAGQSKKSCVRTAGGRIFPSSPLRTEMWLNIAALQPR